MDLNTENKETQQAPPINKQKVADYFVDLYKQKGVTLSQDRALRFAEHPDLKGKIALEHKVLQYDSVPDGTKLDSLIGTFVDEPVLEKKNQVQNTIGILESSSVLQPTKPLSVSESPVVERKLDEFPIKTEKIFNDALSRVDMNVFSSEPDKAIPFLSDQFSVHGFTFEKSGPLGSKIKAVAPDGTSKEFSFFTEEYKSLLPKQENVDQLASIRLDDFKSWMQSQNSQTPDFIIKRLESADTVSWLGVLKNVMDNYNREQSMNIVDLLDGVDDEDAKGFYTRGLEATSGKEIKDLQEQLRRKVLSKGELLPIRNKTEKVIERNKKSAEGVSYLMGDILYRSGKWKSINVDNIKTLEFFQSIGLRASDLPTNAIKVNGKPTTFNQLTQNYLYDFDKVQDIRDGKIKIEIDNPKFYGWMGPLVERASKIVETQKAYDKYSAYSGPSKVVNKVFGETYEAFSDFAQNAGLSVYELGVTSGYALYDALRATGVDEDYADAIVYGNTGFTNFSGFRPEYLDNAREEYLPFFKGSYTSAGLHEFLYRGITDVGKSVASTGIFFVPGGQGVALSNVFVSSYANDRQAFDKLAKSIQRTKDEGYTLTEEEQRVLDISGNKARGVSLLKAAGETLVTSAFTGRFFKNMHNLKGMKPRIEQTFGSMAKFNNAYAKALRRQTVNSVANALRINPKAFLAEIPEEQFISVVNYGTDVAFGIKEYNGKEFKDLLVNTGIASAFSSYAIGTIAYKSSDPKVLALGDEIVRNSISLPGENILYSAQLDLDAKLAAKEVELKMKGVENIEDDFGWFTLKNELERVSSDINALESEKAKIVKGMNSGEKRSYMDLARRMYDLKDALSRAEDKGQVDAINKQYLQLRDQARQILSKHPSEISILFADNDTRIKFESDALESIKKEKESKGESAAGISTESEIVKQRASELYNEFVINNQETERDTYEGFKAFGPAIRSKEFDVLTDEQRSNYNKDVNDITNFIDNFVNPPEPFLFSGLNEMVKGIEQRVQDKTQADLLSLLDDDQKKLYDLISRSEDPAVREELLDFLEKMDPEKRQEVFNLIGETDLRQPDELEMADYAGFEFANRFSRSLSEGGEVSAEGKRLIDIGKRFKSLGLADSKYQLSDDAVKTIAEFKEDIRNNRKPKYGKVESLLESMEIVNQVFANSGGKIDLTSFYDKDGTALEIGTAKYVEFINKLYTGTGFSTKDVLKRVLFRDQSIGKPVVELIDQLFQADATGTNKAKTAKANHLEAYEREGGKITPDNDIEMAVLSMLKRETGTIIPEGKDEEFARAQTLILEELQKRERVSKANPSDTFLKEQYENFKNVVERLNVAEAMSYDDVVPLAKKWNVNQVDRMASIMPGQRAFDRINDFEAYEAFQYKEGTYIPLFIKKDNVNHNDYFGSSRDIDTESVAESLKDVTRPETLGTDLRLNPEFFFDNFYATYEGVEKDILGNKVSLTLDYIFNDPKFRDMFVGDDGVKQPLLRAFSNLRPEFKKGVRRGSSSVIDPALLSGVSGKNISNIFNKLMSTVYGTATAAKLARIAQRPAQYYSAILGSAPFIKNRRAGMYLMGKTAKFTVGAAGITDGNTRTTVLGNNIGGAVMYKDPKLGNIYMNSRTGLRNSLLSSLAVDENKEIPASYYVSAFNLDAGQASLIEKSLGSTFAVDKFLEFAAKSNELALEIFLASADRIAANHAFEAHYIDYKISNGAKIGADIDAWWEAENKNPDLAAIRYADDIVARTMRQSSQLSESDVYKADAHPATKFFMRSFYTYGKFIMNAKSDITANFAILIDPKVPLSQKRIAERAVLGRMSEIVSFNAIKHGAGLAFIGGFASTLLAYLGVDEEDIEKLGGMTELISEKILPLVSEEDFDPLSLGLDEATTLEEYNAIVKTKMQGITEIMNVANEFQFYRKTYENKFKLQDSYSVFGPTIEEFINTSMGIPMPQHIDDLTAILFNDLYGEDIATEFLSRDIPKTETYSGLVDFASEKMGLYSIAAGQWESYMKARDMSKDFVVKKFLGDLNTVTYSYLSAPNDVMRRQLIDATHLLLSLRLHAMINPVAPRADLDRMADKLERTIETYFSDNSEPDPNMSIYGDSSLFPAFFGIKELQGELMPESFMRQMSGIPANAKDPGKKKSNNAPE